MSGRFPLACLLLLPLTAAGQDEPRPAKSPQLVVTLGARALGRENTNCKAVGFTPDGRSVRVYDQFGVHRWDINTGTYQDDKKFADIDYNDLFYPSPDGKVVLHFQRGNNASKARLIDADTGQVLFTRDLAAGGAVQPADDGRCVAIGGGRSTTVVSLKEKDKAESLAVVGVDDVRRFAAAADAKVFAVVADDRVTVWTTAGEWKLDLPKDTAYTSVALTADGGTLATASARETDDGKRPGPVELWDVKARTKLRAMAAVEWFAEAPHRLRFAPDGKTLVAGDGAYLRGWVTATGAKTFAVEPGWGWTGNVQISPDGKHVAVAYPSRPMVYDLATGRQPTNLHGHSGPVWDIAVSPDGTRAATAMFGRPTVNLWDTTTGRHVGELNAAFAKPSDGRLVPGRVRLQFSPDGAKVLTVNEASRNDGPLRVWDAKSLGLLREIPAPGGDVPAAAFAAKGLFAILNRTPTLLDADTGAAVWRQPAVSSLARVAVSARGDRIAVEGRKGTTIHDAATGAELDRADGEPVRFTLDGTGLILEGKKYAARFRDSSAKKDGPTTENAADGEAFAASDTGLVAVRHAGVNPPEFRVYNARTGVRVSTCEWTPINREVVMAPIQPGDKLSFAFSPDGRTFAVVGEDVRCFETYSGVELFRSSAGAEVRAVAFSPDGRRLFTSHGSEETGTQVLGWDTTGREGKPSEPATAADVEGLKVAIGGKPEAARRALERFATRPADAVAFAREVTALATAADYTNYKQWLTELDAPAFATRETAMKALAKAGWRAEAMMRQLLEKTESVESRERLEKLLAKRDMRPLRAVQLLEAVGTPDAVAALKALAGGPPESLVVQDARWALLRMGK
jgi:WD40 repeat protein